MAQPPEQPSKVESWAYPFPLKTTNTTYAPEDYLGGLAAAEDGFYPLGANGLWHGGIHFGSQTAGKFDQDGSVKCIADGEVVAFRLDSKIRELVYPDGSKAGYSSGFTLVRHRLVLPTAAPQPSNGNGTSPGTANAPPPGDVLTYFSLYMHTLPLDGYDASHPPHGAAKALPAYYGASHIYSVGSKANDPRLTASNQHDSAAIGLRVRASHSSHASVLGWLPRGTKIKVGQKHGEWGKIASFVEGAAQSYREGETPNAAARTGWIYVGEMDDETQPLAVDEVYVLPTPRKIAAGETVAYIGEYQRLVEARNHHTLPPKLGQRPLIHVEMFTGDDLDAFIARSRTRAQRIDPKSRTLLLISKGATLAQPARPDSSIADGVAIKVTADSPASGQWCKVQAVNASGHPVAGQPALWIARADLPHTGERDAWSGFPLSVNSTSGATAAWTRVVTTGSAQHCVESEGKTWYAVSIADDNNAQIDGWVCDHGHPLVELKSPWDWPGFEVMSLGTSVSDMFQRALFIADSGTPDELATFEDSFNSARLDETIKKLEDAIDSAEQRDGKITAHELQLSLGKPWLADRIDHLIVRYESEWGGEMSKWDALDSHMHAGLPVWQAEKTRIDALRFWNGVASVTGFPASSVVYHLHPMGLVGNFISGRRRHDFDLGKLSSHFETGGRGSIVVSGGQGDPGGVSYGAYQMTSKTRQRDGTFVIGGTVQKFVNSSEFPWKNDFAGLIPGTTAFSAKWRETVTAHPDEFKEVEHNYVRITHFDVQITHVMSETEIDLRYHAHAVNDVVWSTCVQLGPSTDIVVTAIRNVDETPAETKGYDRKLIDAIYDERGRKDGHGKLVHFIHSSDAQQVGVSQRYDAERPKAQEELTNETAY
ncbi:SH3 domain-containing protein [Paraburkholderia sp. BCC1884]|uniref:SH3 domain-containing protein n=1 Tax=Paraburkholderia sp. BCC1884 TaxID=2562668 RepID=UPI0011830C79|nr:SH3 domain-containing protein [Paraburkholderia sp. BCC1884]